MPTGYDPTFVALSFFISAVGAFVALTASAGIARPGRSISRINVLSAGLALGGIGIWSMHFIGMLAVKVDMAVSYSIVETFLSLLIAVGATAFALLTVARHPSSVKHILGAGALLGVSVCAMHYIGMYGMRFGGFLQWNFALIGASVLIAWVAATAALLLAFFVRNVAARVVASLVMAAAVAAMHYTGMAAADVICTTPTPLAFPDGWGAVSSLQLPSVVAAVALGIACVILIDQFFQHVAVAQARVAVPVRGDLRRR